MAPRASAEKEIKSYEPTSFEQKKKFELFPLILKIFSNSITITQSDKFFLEHSPNPATFISFLEKMDIIQNSLSFSTSLPYPMYT